MTCTLRTATWKAKTLVHCGATHPGRHSPPPFPNQEDPLPTSWPSLWAFSQSAGQWALGGVRTPGPSSSSEVTAGRAGTDGPAASSFPVQHCPSWKLSPDPAHPADCLTPNTRAPPQSLSSGTGVKSQGLEIRKLTAPPPQTQGHIQGSHVTRGTIYFTYWDQQEPGLSCLLSGIWTSPGRPGW